MMEQSACTVVVKLKPAAPDAETALQSVTDGLVRSLDQKAHHYLA